MQRKLSYQKIKISSVFINITHNIYNMTTLGYSSVNSNQILQPNIAGGANPSGGHFTDPVPQFSSIVGGVSGCGGPGGSAASLRANPGYNVEKMPQHHHHQKGGSSHRRGGKKRQSSKKRSHRRKRSGHKRSGHKRSGHKRSGHKRSGNKKRSMRGGLATFSPASFSGASNLPYHQFTGGQPLSFNFGLGSTTALPPNLIGMASPPPMMDIHNNCGSNYGMINLIK
jgi:hypothetical protein